MEEENRMIHTFDELDYKILNRLKDDCRMSLRKMSKEIGIPHTTIHTRVLMMETRGLINFFVSLVPEKLGLREAVVLIKCPGNQFEYFVEDLKDEGLVDLKQTDKGLLATFLFPEKTYYLDLEEMLVYLDKTFGYKVEAFAVNQHKALNNFNYIKKTLKK